MKKTLSVARIGLCAAALAACSQDSGSPNIIIITIDTLRSDAVGVYGGESGLTPQIDAFAESATLFERATAPMGVTAPSHASLFTGLYPRRHGLRSNFATLADEQITLAEVLAERGYDTAAWVGFNLLLGHAGLRQGFALPRAEDVPRVGGRTGAGTNDKAVRWLERPHERPFFVWLHYFEAHAPYDRTPYSARELADYSGPLKFGASVEQFYGMGDEIPWSDEARHALRALYEGEVGGVDRLVGEVLEALDETGLADDTIVVLAGDHGQLLGERDRVGHTGRLDEAVLWVPLIVRDPRNPGGRRVRERVGLVDIFPTLIELAGGTPSARLDGRSLVPALRGEALAQRDYFGEVPDRGDAATDLQPSTIAIYRDALKGIGTRRRFDLYDLEQDPSESRPLEGVEQAGELRRLAGRHRDLGRAARPDATVPDDLAAELRELGYAE